MTPVISFENVVKQYNDREVISSLSFKIYSREVVGMLGPSGIGKTTILKIVAGLATVTSGKATIIAKQIGYVFQEPRLFPWKTALENVMLPLMAKGISKGEASEKGKHYLKAMGLEEFLGYYPAELSGGMMQRVSLARAFAVEPDILLLDEPFSALDSKLRDGLLTMLGKQLREQPMTVLYVSHSSREVARIANRIFMMSHEDGLTELPVSLCATLETDPEKVSLSPPATS